MPESFAAQQAVPSPARGGVTPKSANEPNSRALILSRVTLALFPLSSFLLQLILSQAAGTEKILFRHLTVTVVDWIFIPFNYFVVPVIDWGKGAKLYAIFCVSVILNCVTHAYWQYHQLDLGHMIRANGVVLPAGWVHLVFSTVEMVLLVAFVFCRRNGVPSRNATVIATTYFVTMSLVGYHMHQRFILSDVVVFTSGLFFVLIYPRLVAPRLKSF